MAPYTVQLLFHRIASLICAWFDLNCYGLVPRSSSRQADLILTVGTVTKKIAPYFYEKIILLLINSVYEPPNKSRSNVEAKTKNGACVYLTLGMQTERKTSNFLTDKWKRNENTET